jgi:hypothetical protein
MTDNERARMLAEENLAASQPVKCSVVLDQQLMNKINEVGQLEGNENVSWLVRRLLRLGLEKYYENAQPPQAGGGPLVVTFPPQVRLLLDQLGQRSAADPASLVVGMVRAQLPVWVERAVTEDQSTAELISRLMAGQPPASDEQKAASERAMTRRGQGREN